MFGLFNEYHLRTPELCEKCGEHRAEWGTLCGFCLSDEPLDIDSDRTSEHNK